MLIDLYKSRTDQAGMTARGFLPTAPRGFGDAFGAAFDAATAPDEWGRTAQFRRKQYDDAVAAYEKHTGNKLVSPSLYETDRAKAISDLGTTGPDLKTAIDKHRADVDRALAEAHKQFSGVPDPAGFDQAIADESVRRRDLEARVNDVSGFGAKAGLFLGGMAGEMTHPVQVMTLPFGGVGGGAAKSIVGRLAVSAAEQAAIGAGSQAVIEAGDYTNRKKFGTQQTLSQAASNIALAAAGGALFDAAFKAGPRVIGAGSRAVAAQGRSVLDRFGRAPRAGLDAVNVAESDAFTMASAGRSADMAKHAESLAEAVRSVDQGRSAPTGGEATVLSFGGAPRTPPAAADFPTVTSDAQGMLTPVKQTVKADIGKPTSEALQGVNRVYTASGRGVDVEYAVVEAQNLVTSHGHEMAENPAFPAELQPRDRTRLASQDQISSMAARLQPERLAGGSDAATGAPIIGPDNVVESGNGRVLALQQAYRRFPEKAREYRQHLETLGFDAGHMSEPVLVRRRATALTPEARIAFTREANEAAIMSMGAGEQAFTDAKRIPNGILDLYRGGDLDLVRNRRFALKVVEALPASERAAMLTAEGELSQAGVKRLEGALLAKAYGDTGLIGKLTEATENDIRAIGKALAEAAPAWAQMRARVEAGDIAPGMDVTADLLSAVRMIEHSRGEGQSVGDLLRQGQMFGEGLTEPAFGFLRAMFKDADFSKPAPQSVISERLGQFIDEANKTTPGPDMFGAPPLTAGEVLASKPHVVQITPEPLVSKAAEAAEVSSAIDTELARVLEVDDLQIPVEVVEVNGQRQVKMRSARELVSEAKAQVKVARQVAMCATGKLIEAAV
jgi:hypothetical protein